MKLSLIIMIILIYSLTLPLCADTGTQMEVVIQNCHTKMVKAIAYSPDGRFFASCSQDSTIKLWTYDGKLLRTMIGHTNHVNTIAFSPDNSMIASGGEDAIKLWDLYGNLLHTFGEDSCRTNSVAFTPDGTYLLSGGAKTVIWNIEGREGKIIKNKYVLALAVNIDGSIFATSSQKKVCLWKQDGSLITEIKIDDSVIRGLAFNPKNGRLTGISWSGNVYTWDVEGTLVRTFNLGKNLHATNLVFGPDGESIYTNGSWNNFIRIRKFSIEGKPVRNFPGMGNIVNTFAVSPDERYVTGGGYDVKIYDTATNTVSFFKYLSKDPYHLAFSPSGGMFASTNWDIVRLWSIDGRLITAVKPRSGSMHCISFNPDGKIIAGGTTVGKIHLWDTKGEPLKTLHGHTKQNNTGFPVVNALSFHPGGEILVSGGNDMTVRTWNINGTPIHTFTGHTDRVGAIACSPDGKLIASGSADDTIRIWDIEGNLKGIINVSGWVDNLIFMSDSRHVLFNSGKEIRLCDIDGNPVRTYKAGNEYVDSLAVNADYSLIAAGYRDGKIVFFSPEGTIIKTLSDNESRQWVLSLAFNPKNNQMISGSMDSTVKIWNIKSNRHVSLLASGREWIMFTPDGYFDASKTGGGLVSMVKGTAAYRIDQFALFKNRPDLILKRVGSNNTQLIEHFFNQYIKRLAKSYALPRIIDKDTFTNLEKAGKKKNATKILLSCYRKSEKSYILRENIPITGRYALLSLPGFLSITERWHGAVGMIPQSRITSINRDGCFVEIDFVFTGKTHKLESYNIYINDVPLFGGKGKHITGNEYKGSERIELTDGINKVEISCRNEIYSESYRNYTTLLCEKQGTTDLYFIGFGVSDYKDTSLNLLYPHKDVEDLARLFSYMGNRNIKGRFKKVHTKTFTNSECTVKNIKTVKEFLKQAGVDDTVVILISGHGVHDNDDMSTYYYLTHEANISNLSQTAASFDLIESILDGIKPRKKLFLMDTCESGEIDKELATGYLAIAGSKGLAVRTIKKGSASGKGIRSRANRPYLLQRDRYINNDLFRRTGTIVFSSSRGNEFSYEPAVYRKDQNGFFTRAIIESLIDSNAEKSNDNMRSIDEMSDYVIEDVSKRTSGLQNPTIDRDNIYQKINFPPAWWLKGRFYSD